MTRSIPVGEVRPLGDRAFLIGVADAAAGRVLARALRGRAGGSGRRGVRCGHGHGRRGRPRRRPAIGRGRGGGGASPTAPAARPPRRSGRARSPGDRPLPIRRAGPRRGGGAGAVPSRRGGRAPDGGAPDRQPWSGSRPDSPISTGFPARCNGCPGARARARRCRPGRWPSPAGTPPSIPPHPPGAGSWSAAPPSPSSRRGVRPMPCWRRGIRCASPWPGPARPTSPSPVAAPPWSLPPAPDRSSRCWSRACAPWSRTVAGVPWPPWASPGPARPTRCRFTLANRLAGNTAGAGALELTGGGTRLRVPRRLPRRRRGRRPRGPRRRHRGGGRPAPPPRPGPGARGRTPARRVAAPTCRWPAASWGRRGSPAPPATSSPGSGPARWPPGRLHAGPWAPPLGDHLTPGAATELEPGAPVALRVLPGPHAELFEPDALARLAGAVFEVGPASNRVGLRLRAVDGGATRTRRTAGRSWTHRVW